MSLAALDNIENPVLSGELANNGFSYLARKASQLLVRHSKMETEDEYKPQD
jgi:hypothetical protein